MEKIITHANETYLSWSHSALNVRLSFLPTLAHQLLENKAAYAAIITSEMHKPISQAIAEVEKCALLKLESFLSALLSRLRDPRERADLRCVRKPRANTLAVPPP